MATAPETSSPQNEPVNLALSETATTPPPAPAPAPAAPVDGGTPPAPAGDAKAELAAITETGNTNRLSPGDEDRATRLMRDCLLEGGAGIPAALSAMPRLPWILGVRAIENAWPQLPGPAREEILEGLKAMDSDNAFRLRLSVARALAKLGASEAVKVAAAACLGMWSAETGSLKAEHSKLIGNVFIGRGKPWIVQLPLAELSDAEADGILSAAVFSTFNVNNPPITQLSILRYAGARIGRLHPNLLGMVAKSVGRWNGKWQSSLRKEVAELPEPLLAALKPERDSGEPAAAEAGEPAPAGTAEPEEIPIPAELEEKLRLASESGDPSAVEAVTQEINTWRDAQRIARLEALDAEDEEEEDDEDEDEEPGDGQEPSNEGRDRRGRGRRDRKERPAYVSREQEARGLSGFNYANAIKQLDAYVNGLRKDLAAAEARLRRTEDEGRKSRRENADRPLLSHEEANLSPDELKRLVIQLEARNTELQARVEELTTDSEARGLAMAAGTTEPAPDPATQLRTLLALKLADDYADFLTLQKESPDAIVQQHYPGLIKHVFETLLAEQVPLRAPEEPVQPGPPPVPPVTE